MCSKKWRRCISKTLWVLSREVQEWLEQIIQVFREQIIQVFREASVTQCRLFCCSLWCLWTERNKQVNENIVKNSNKISRFIIQYMKELERIKATRVARDQTSEVQEPLRAAEYKVNFDAAYDRVNFISGSGMVIRNSKVKFLLQRRFVTPMWALPSLRRPLHAQRQLKCVQSQIYKLLQWKGTLFQLLRNVSRTQVTDLRSVHSYEIPRTSLVNFFISDFNTHHA